MAFLYVNVSYTKCNYKYVAFEPKIAAVDLISSADLINVSLLMSVTLHCTMTPYHMFQTE